MEINKSILISFILIIFTSFLFYYFYYKKNNKKPSSSSSLSNSSSFFSSFLNFISFSNKTTTITNLSSSSSLLSSSNISYNNLHNNSNNNNNSYYNDNKTEITENMTNYYKEKNHFQYVLIEPPEKKWLLQSRVANVKNSNDLYQIFDEFDILHRLKLPVERLTNDITQLTEQTFRDLVRDKININDELVKVDDIIACSPELFQNYFHNKIKEAISDHQTDLEKINTLALYICCHLSRTRAGGDSFFAVKEIFDSPQLVIIASHTDTHPPTDLHITDDGWAYITTTSNFDVYLHEHLHPQEIEGDDCDNQLVHPLPLATLSARLEEAIVIGEKKDLKQSLPQPILTQAESKAQTTKNWSDLPLPLYRRMSIVCFDPTNPNVFHGGWTSAGVNEQNDTNDHNHPYWDQETVQTSNDGIICISSSMSGAAQLCLPVSRSNKPILPYQKIQINSSNIIDSDYTTSDHTTDSISFTHLEEQSNQRNQLLLQQQQQKQQQEYFQQQKLIQEQEHNGDNENVNIIKNIKKRKERQDSVVLSTGDSDLFSTSSTSETNSNIPIINTSNQILNEEETTSVKRKSNLIDSE